MVHMPTYIQYICQKSDVKYTYDKPKNKHPGILCIFQRTTNKVRLHFLSIIINCTSANPATCRYQSREHCCPVVVMRVLLLTTLFQGLILLGYGKQEDLGCFESVSIDNGGVSSGFTPVGSVNECLEYATGVADSQYFMYLIEVNCTLVLLKRAVRISISTSVTVPLERDAIK